MPQWAYIHHQFVDASTATISIRDLSVQRGYGIFDFFRVEAGRPLFLPDHLQRFYRNAAHLRLDVGYTPHQLTDLIHQLIQKNGVQQAGGRLTLTGGNGTEALQTGIPVLAITIHDFRKPSSQLYTEGIRLITYPHRRQLPHIKSIDYLMAVWLQPLLESQKADDVLYGDAGGVSECPRSNFFLVMKDDTIVTPAEGVLHGITRQKVIQLAAGMFKVEERAVGVHEIHLAREAFITSTTKQILPVRQIDDKLFETEANEVTRQLQVRLANLINENIGL